MIGSVHVNANLYANSPVQTEVVVVFPQERYRSKALKKALICIMSELNMELADINDLCQELGIDG